MKVKAVITGIKAIDRKLHTLPLRIQKKVVNQALRAAMKTVQTAVKVEVPVDTGTTKKNIKVRAALKRKRGAISLDVRIDANDQTKKTSPKSGETVFYPAIVEYKHNHYMRRAFDSAGESARRVALSRIRAGIEREAKSS